jgi:predicted SPOUT superfamily RNA methylase MTH1
MSNFTFQIGDRVLRADVRNPQHLREGIVTRVTPNQEGIDSLVKYVIDFGSDYAVLFENELLQLVPYAKLA